MQERDVRHERDGSTDTHRTYPKGLALEDGVEELEGVHAAGLLHVLEKGQLARRAHGVQD